VIFNVTIYNNVEEHMEEFTGGMNREKMLFFLKLSGTVLRARKCEE